MSIPAAQYVTSSIPWKTKVLESSGMLTTTDLQSYEAMKMS